MGITVVGASEAIESPTEMNACVEQASISILSAAKFARSLKKDDEVSIMLLEQLRGGLKFTHHTEHGDSVKKKIASSEEILDRLEKDFPKVFEPPVYLITNDRILFSIPLIDPAKSPAHRKLYPLSQAESDKLKKQLTDLLDSGRIVPMASPYGHPILFAGKKGGSRLRLCVDCRSLNANTIIDAWPFPKIDELLSKLCGATIFSKIDLRDGYHQIPIAEHEQYKTDFSCRYGNFQYRVMPFGLKNAPAHFQRTMNMMLRDMLDTYVLVYLDDILIFCKSRAKNKLHIRQVFEWLQQCNFHIKRSKCEIFIKNVEFLGHQVSKKGIIVMQYKVEAVASWPIPQNIRHIQ